jgi:hypothetical protein
MVRHRLHSAMNLKGLMALASGVQDIIQENHGENEQVELDLTDVLPVDTAFYVTAANLLKLTRAKGVKDITFVLSGVKYQLDEFHASLKSVADDNPARLEHLERFELSSFISANPGIVQDFVGRFQEYIPNISAKTERFENTLAELMENVYVHSRCPWGGYLYGYLNKTAKTLQFSIADFGTGIPWTLAEVAPYDADFDDDTLTYEASKYSVSSKNGRAGSGLDLAASFAKDIGGIMRIYSRKGCLRIDSDAKCLLEADAEYPGTLITIELPLR